MQHINVLKTGPLGVNTYVVGSGDSAKGSLGIIIDPAACLDTGDGNEFADFVKSMGFGKIAVVLTHGHFDHVAGLCILKERCGKDLPECRFFIHREDSMALGNTGWMYHERFLGNAGWGMENLIQELKQLPEAHYFLEDGKSLAQCIDDDFFSENELAILGEYEVIHTPGHSRGSCCLYDSKEGILFSGDTVFWHSWGRTDFEGGSEGQIQQSLSMLHKKLPSETKVFPGHDYYGFTLDE